MTGWCSALAREGKTPQGNEEQLPGGVLPSLTSARTDRHHDAEGTGGSWPPNFPADGCERGRPTEDGSSELVHLHSDVERPSVKGLGGRGAAKGNLFSLPVSFPPPPRRGP